MYRMLEPIDSIVCRYRADVRLVYALYCIVLYCIVLYCIVYTCLAALRRSFLIAHACCLSHRTVPV